MYRYGKWQIKLTYKQLFIIIKIVRATKSAPTISLYGKIGELAYVSVNWVKFTQHNFKGKFDAPVFSVSIGFPYKVNGFVKTSTQESLL